METFTQKKDKRYRYFACEKDMKRINSICPLKRVPAAELENLLLREIGSMLAKPEVIAGGIRFSSADRKHNVYYAVLSLKRH